MKVMMGRMVVAAALVAGCGAQLGPPDNVGSQAVPDGAATDARPCSGGDAAMVGPDGTCFVHVTTRVMYLQAKAACEAMNAHLAYLKNAAVDSFAETFIGNVNTYIGGSDRGTEGTFQWEDGTALGFTNWRTGEPSNGDGTATFGEDCLVIAGARTGKQWDDRPCDASELASFGGYAYLCNY